MLPLKNKLYRLALRITLNPEDAEDTVQETMMKVWNRREQWEQLESMEAFCMTICRNIAVDKTRKMGSSEQSLDNDEHDAPDHSHSANPEEQAEGKSYKEIAVIMGISEEQVKVSIFRARQTIKQKYIQAEEYGL